MKYPYNLLKKAIEFRAFGFEMKHRTGWKPFQKNLLPQKAQEVLLKRHLRYLLEFPTAIQVEVTNICNAKCWFCPQPSSNRKKGHMKFDLFKKIADEIAPYSKRVRTISLFMDGEPTLNPNILGFLKYAHKLGIEKINISSNMECFTPELTDSILSSNLGKTLQYVICSIDGASKEVYAEKRIGINFEKVLTNTEYLISKRNQMKRLYPWVFARLLVSYISEKDIELFKNTWKNKADKVLCSPMHNWGGQIVDERLKTNINHKEFHPCYFPFSQFAIQYDGIVRLCCLDTNESVIIGDVKRNSINEIWKGIEIDRIRNFHLNKKVEEVPFICKNCTYPIKGTWTAPFYW